HRTAVKKQVLHVPNALEGLAWNPSGQEFYVGGWINGPNGFVADEIFIFHLDAISHLWSQVAMVPLGHTTARSMGFINPAPAGIAVTADGGRLVAANFENDSISVINLQTRTKTAELPLWPGQGIPGGEYPFWVAIKGNETAFVSSTRDRQIVVVNIGGASPTIADRIQTKGQPTRMILDHD